MLMSINLITSLIYKHNVPVMIYKTFMKQIVVIGQAADVLQRLHDVVNFQVLQDVACNRRIKRDIPVTRVKTVSFDYFQFIQPLLARMTMPP